jgi:hypothetical protein
LWFWPRHSTICAVSRLLWRDAQGLDGAVDLGPGEIFIGRALECAVRTEDAMVSRHHARVFQQAGQYYIEDLGSSNGVFYQEQRVQRHALRHGDAVRCGSLWLRFIDPRALRGSPSTSPPPAGPADPAGAPPMAPTGPPPGARAGGAPAAEGRVAQPAGGDRSGSTGGDPEEIPRLRRRLEQLQAELRIYRGSGEGARTLESLEDEVARVEEERDRFKARAAELEARLVAEGGDAKVRKAGEIAQSASEIVAGLNDVLSNLRINVMAAEGEFEQFAANLPRASFELIREALRSSAGDVDSARELLRKLRGLT